MIILLEHTINVKIRKLNFEVTNLDNVNSYQETQIPLVILVDPVVQDLLEVLFRLLNLVYLDFRVDLLFHHALQK